MATEVVTIDALVALLRDPEWCEAPVTDGISPLTLVSVPRASHVRLPTALPRLVVGVGSGATSVAGFDLAAADDDVASLETACTTSPRAVSVLAQLLRASEELPLADAVLAESLAYSSLLAGEEFARWRAAQPPRAHHDGDGPPVRVDDDGTTLTITLDRPAVHNAYDAAMRDALVDALRAAVALGGARRVVLCGAGPSFSSGGDLSEFGTTHDVALAHLVRTARAPGLLVAALGVDAHAVVHGTCVGAGVELPAFCARVEAAPGTTFCLPEIAMGLVPGAGGTAGLPRRIGRRRTAWLAVTGRTIDASTAKAWGLVDVITA